MKRTATVTAWASGDYMLNCVMQAAEKGNSRGVVDSLQFTNTDMADSGFVKVGTARVTVELLTQTELASQQLTTLQAELKKERANSQMRQNAILERISKLQALEFTGSPA